MMKLYRIISALLILVAVVACSSGGGSVADPYADPEGAVEPATIDNPTVVPTMSLGTPNANGLIEVNVSGLGGAGAAGVSALSAEGLSAEDFTLVEDGVVKGITVRRISSGGGAAAADVVFVLDTTASMGPGLNSVVDSIEEFTDYLAGSGLDVNVGAITFGDAFDTHLGEHSNSSGESFMDETPPGFDREERASLKLTNDYASFMEYLTYEAREHEWWSGGGRHGGDVPENALGALEYAFDEAPLAWRPGAQKHFVVITDACSHNEDTADRARIVDPWMPTTVAEVVGKMRGHAQVHVIEPLVPSCVGAADDYSQMKELTGIDATGGVYVEWEKDEYGNWATFDLTELELTDAMSSGGYIITYRGSVTGKEHTVRLVVDNDSDMRGEMTVIETY